MIVALVCLAGMYGLDLQQAESTARQCKEYSIAPAAEHFPSTRSKQV